MSFLQYLGLLLLSHSWLLLTYAYRPPRLQWIGFVVGGLVLLALAARERRPAESPVEALARRLPPLAGVLLVPLVLCAIVFPRPFGIGPALLAAAVAVGVLVGDRGTSWLRPLPACLLGGAVLTLQGLVLPLLAVFSAHYHEVPFFGYVLYPLVRLIDPSAVLSGGNIFILNPEEIFGLSVSWEKLQLIPFALFFAAVCLARVVQRERRHSLVRIFLIFVVYAAVRWLFVVFTVVLSNRDYAFWEPQAILLSLIPLPLVLAWLAPSLSPAFVSHGGAAGASRRTGILIGGSALAAVAAFLVAGSMLFHDPGALKRGRILFDEHYSDWEWSTQAYDRDWYGQRSGYNYYNLAEYLTHFYELERGQKPFTLEYLSAYDVVIVKTPTRPFTPQEIDALVAYVRGGGGLYLIGDHTNVFGTSTYLNPVAGRFGLRFNYDSTYQLASMALSYYDPPPLVAHPVVSNFRQFLFATSCTIDGPLFGENVIVGYGLRGIMLDYSQRSFFPTKEEKEYQFGFLMQSAGARAGSGRVLGFTDSTVFSNFFMFMPGKPELFLGSVDWLNRVNRFAWLNIGLFLCGTVAAILTGLALRRMERLRAAGVVCFGALLGLALSLEAFDALTKSAYPLPEPRTAMQRIAFDSDPSKNEMPVRHLVINEKESLQTFYVWTQRVGMAPSLHPTMLEALAAAPIAVSVNPSRPLAMEEVDAVVDFCRSGGTFLLIADPENKRSSADDLLGIFRMKMDTTAIDSTSIMNGAGERICKALHAGAIAGGEPVLTLSGGGAVLSSATLGAGRFFAFSDYRIFSSEVMGSTSEEPTREQREIYELEFQLLEVLMGKRDPAAIKPYKPPVKPPGARPAR